MRLNDLQLKTLKRYWNFHSDGYHSSNLFVAHTKTWFICGVGAAVCYWLAQDYRFHGFAWFWIGYFTAAVVITLKIIRTASRIWNLLEEIVNWDRVREILDAHEPRIPQAPTNQA